MCRVQMFVPPRLVWPGILAVLAAGGLTTNAQNLRVKATCRGEALPDKSIYDLFHPTPNELMREMSTDRPDQTESPYTVDAGHFQVEMDLVSGGFDRDRSGGVEFRTTGWGTLVVMKAGLWNDGDMR